MAGLTLLGTLLRQSVRHASAGDRLLDPLQPQKHSALHLFDGTKVGEEGVPLGRRFE